MKTRRRLAVVAVSMFSATLFAADALAQGGQAGGSAQRGAGARRVGGRLQLDRGHLAPSGCRLARDRGAKSTDITRRFCRCNTDDKQNAKVNRAHPPRVHGG